MRIIAAASMQALRSGNLIQEGNNRMFDNSVFTITESNLDN